MIPGARHKLYYVRPDEIFVKLADIEAEKYVAEQKKREEEAALYSQQQKLRKTHSYDQPAGGQEQYYPEGGQDRRGKPRRGGDRQQ